MNHLLIAPAVLLVVLIGLILYWLLVTTEGTYLGAQVVSLLYNWTAKRYEKIKGFDPQVEDLFLRRPLVRALGDVPTPTVLDVATGTGRVPALLLSTPGFAGRVVGLDLADKMLVQAATKLVDYPDRSVLIRRNAMQLPFRPAGFDLVTCLEALEFMPRPEQVLAEMVRVLRPGGLLFTTRRRGWESSLMPGKCWSKDQIESLLSSNGLERIQTAPWQVDYDLVWGWKPAGVMQEPGPVTTDWWLTNLLCCTRCGETKWQTSFDQLVCLNCDSRFPVEKNGVVQMNKDS